MKELVIESGRLRARVLPEVAGRVASFTCEGRELLVGSDVNADNWGSTYWPSPQATWGWPPIAALDTAPYESVGASALRSQGAALGETLVRLEKRYRAEPSREALIHEFELSNIGERPVSVAGWQISRVAPGGLTFFLLGEQLLTPIEPHGELVVEKALGHGFFDHGRFEPGKSRKVHADAGAGYLAHVTAPGADGRRVLFLKSFVDTRAAEQAPGEGEVEIFANEDGRYVEIEVQGPYQLIQPGESRSFQVEWRAMVLPRELDVRVGSPSLVEFVRGLC